MVEVLSINSANQTHLEAVSSGLAWQVIFIGSHSGQLPWELSINFSSGTPPQPDKPAARSDQFFRFLPMGRMRSEQ